MGFVMMKLIMKSVSLMEMIAVELVQILSFAQTVTVMMKINLIFHVSVASNINVATSTDRLITAN